MGHVSVPFRHAPGGAVVFQKNGDAVPIRKEGGTEVPWKFRKSGKLEVPDYVLSSALDLHFATSATAAVAALQGYGRWQSEVSHRCAPKYDSGSEGRDTAGAQGCGLLRGAPGGKAALSRRARRLRSLLSRFWLPTGPTSPPLFVVVGYFALPMGGGVQYDYRRLGTRPVAESDRRIDVVALGCRFLEDVSEGGLALGGHLRRLGEKDGIAVSLDWVKPEKLVFQDDYHGL